MVAVRAGDVTLAVRAENGVNVIVLDRNERTHLWQREGREILRGVGLECEAEGEGGRTAPVVAWVSVASMPMAIFGRRGAATKAASSFI